MDLAIEEILCGIMGPDTARIHECTAALHEKFKDPLTLKSLCLILVSPRETQVRQLAVMLMNKRLQKLHHWQMVPSQLQEDIKTCMLKSLIIEKHKVVRDSIGQLIATLVRHEAVKKDTWLGDLLEFTFHRCSMVDPKESELGASIFSTLTDAAPDLFLSQLSEAFKLFTYVLMTAQANGDMATPTVANMMMGMCFLIPLVGGHTEGEQTLANTVPLMLFALQAFAQKGVVAEYTSGLEILDSMVEYVPKLLKKSIKNVVGFCLESLSNKEIDASIRVKVAHIVGRLILVKRQTIIKQNMLEPILVVLFEMTCSDGDDEEDEFFLGTGNTPRSSATQTLDLMAMHISSEILLRTLLPIIETALKSPNALRRRGAFMCMAVISEGCSEAIKRKYLETTVNIIIQWGVIDQDPGVRSVSFFALGQISEHMQPEISAYAPRILPILFDFIHQLVVELKMGQPEDCNYINRIFYALEVFCENLEDEIVPHLPVLMDRMFECMDQVNYVRIRKQALCSVAAVATASKSHFLPYLDPIVDLLKQYLVYESKSESLNELRIQAIDTLASIASSVGKTNFMHLSHETVKFCLAMLEQGPDDPDLRRAIYCLLGGLSRVLTDNMNTVFPMIIERMLQTVESTGHDNDNDNNDEDDDEDDDGSDDLQVENDFLFEKAEVMYTLKEFAKNSSKSFSPYLTMALEAVYKNIDHTHVDIRKASIEALCAFVISLDDLDNADGVMRACVILIPKFAYLIKNDEDQEVVRKLLDELGELFRAVKKAALPESELAEAVVGSITDVLLNKTACQYSEPSNCADEHMDEGDREADTEESEHDEMIIESAENLVATIGYALDPETYSFYFGQLYSLLSTKLAKAKKNDDPDQRTLVYGILSDCIQSLHIRVVNYFDCLCFVFLGGITDSEPKVRQCCFFGLGELVYYAEENSFRSFPVILQALSEAIARETHNSALDNICGALARLIVTNCNILPLGSVLPVFMYSLPLREDTAEYDMVLKAFRVLYINARSSILDFIGQIVAVTLHVLTNKQLDDDESTACAVCFMRQIRNDYPDQFNTVANSSTSAELFELVQNLLS